jgi:PhoPQ-activated pathogenicity-related protein
MLYFRVLKIIAIILLFNTLNATPLDDYVNAPDPHFGYQILTTYDMPGYKLYILNFTSQKWLDETVSSQPIWWHYLCVTVPDVITKPDAAFLLIDGGLNNDTMPKPSDNFVELTSLLAVSIGIIGADLQQVPNQPISFIKDPTQQKRFDEAIIAWTWKAFMQRRVEYLSIL